MCRCGGVLFWWFVVVVSGGFEPHGPFPTWASCQEARQELLTQEDVRESPGRVEECRWHSDS